MFAQSTQDPAALLLKDRDVSFFKISAEHITRSAARSVLAYADAQGIAVMHCGPDDVFTDLFHCVVEGRKNASKIQRRFWEHNHGAYCAVVAWQEEDDEDASWL